MEPTFKLKYQQFVVAVEGLVALLGTDLVPYSTIIVDGLKNGQLQKFEYCVELVWKTARALMLEQHGLDAPSPKAAAKALFSVGIVDEALYEAFIEMIDARNQTSHLYVPAVFERIYSRLPAFATFLSDLVRRLGAFV